MNGSKKQIKWANHIKSKLTIEFNSLTDAQKNHPAVKNSVELICKIDDAKWWIEIANGHTAQSILMQIASKQGLRVKFDNMFDYFRVDENGNFTAQSAT